MVVTGIVLASIVGWLLVGLFTIRVIDLWSNGIDEYDRAGTTVFCCIFGPIALVVTIGVMCVWWIAHNNMVRAFLYPSVKRRERKKKAGEELLAEATRYKKLANAAEDEDEKKLLNEVAESYREQASGFGASPGTYDRVWYPNRYSRGY